MSNVSTRSNKAADELEKIQKSLRSKEKQAQEAKEKGMHTSYGNLMAEITELKRKLRQHQMGGK
jgi:uncharacterized alpha-E superfamily protein